MKLLYKHPVIILCTTYCGEGVLRGKVRPYIIYIYLQGRGVSSDLIYEPRD